MASLRLLRIFSLIGLVLFGAVFVTTLVAPAQVERAAKAFLLHQVKAEVGQALATPAGGTAKEIYDLLQAKLASQSEETRALIKARFAEAVARMIAKLAQLDCETTSKLAEAIEQGLKGRLAELKVITGKVKGFAQDKYDQTLANLIHELRIFSGAFAVLLAASFLRREQARALALPAWLLFAATMSACTIYLFGQNWFYAIVLNDYVGYAYPAYIGVIFVFLMDIVFNGATLTLFVVELIMQIVGALLRALTACLPG